MKSSTSTNQGISTLSTGPMSTVAATFGSPSALARRNTPTTVSSSSSTTIASSDALKTPNANIVKATVAHGLSSEYIHHRDNLLYSQSALATIVRDIDNFRQATHTFLASARALHTSTFQLLQTKDIPSMIGAPCFDAILNSHNQMLNLIETTGTHHTDILLQTLKNQVLPSMEQAQTLQKEMHNALDLRNTLAREVDTLVYTKKMETAMKAIQATGSHRDASANFAQLQAEAITACEQVETNLQQALHSSLTEVTIQQAAEIQSLATTMRMASNLVRLSAPPKSGMDEDGFPLTVTNGDNTLNNPPGTPGETERNNNPFFSSTALTVNTATKAPVPSSSSSTSTAMVTTKATDPISTSLNNQLSPLHQEFFRTLAVPCLPGEELLARVDRVRNDILGDFGLLTVSNYRIRFHSINPQYHHHHQQQQQQETSTDLSIPDPSSSHHHIATAHSHPHQHYPSSASKPNHKYGHAKHTLSASSSVPHHFLPKRHPHQVLSSSASRPQHHYYLTDYDVDLDLKFSSPPNAESTEHAQKFSGMLPPVVLSIPLLSIARCEALNGANGALVLGTTDMRVLSFSFGAADYDVTSLASLLAPYMWVRAPLFPFKYTLASPVNGSTLYTADKEFQRLRSATPSNQLNPYTVSTLNRNFKLCSTYPEQFILPEAISEPVLLACARFRSKQRFPAITWFRGSLCLARCSQPLSGVFNARNGEDERVLSALIAAPGTSISGTNQLAIYDARPRLNALGNAAKGGGSEVMANYSFATLEYLNIDNIHVVREGLAELRGRIVRYARQSLEKHAIARVSSTLDIGTVDPRLNLNELSLLDSGDTNLTSSVLHSGGEGELTSAALAALSMSDIRSPSIAVPNDSTLSTGSMHNANGIDYTDSTLIGLSLGNDTPSSLNEDTNNSVTPHKYRLFSSSSQRHSTGNNDGAITPSNDNANPVSSNLSDDISPMEENLGTTATAATNSLSSKRSFMVSARMMVKKFGLRKKVIGTASTSSSSRKKNGNTGNGMHNDYENVPSPGAQSPRSMLARSSSFSWPSTSRNGSAASFGEDSQVVVSSPFAGNRTISLNNGSNSSGNNRRELLWQRLLSIQLEGAVKVATSLMNGTSVLVHCSDGWDRTSALSALAQLMIDPYYRTLEGVCVLIQKEWVAYGHRFARRCGTGGCDTFRGEANDSQRAPIFVQFVDCVYQMVRQFPNAFEFNYYYLETLAEQVYMGKFGTFLYDCEKDRTNAGVYTNTVSLWSYVLMPDIKDKFTNPNYVPVDVGVRQLSIDTNTSNGSTNGSSISDSGTSIVPETNGSTAYPLIPVIPATNVESLAIWSYWETRWIL